MTHAHRDRLLVALTFAAGCVDALSYLGLGRVFTANMTGNAVLLGLAIGQAEELRVLHSAVALGFFVAGVWLGSRLVGPAREAIVWSPRVTNGLVAELVLLAMLAAGWWGAGARPGGPMLDALLALSAMAMGVQSAVARRCAVSGVSTTYITGTLTGLMAELAGLAGAPQDWARLVAVLGALVAGAVVGGVALTSLGPRAAVVPAVVVAAVVVGAVAGFRPDGRAGSGSAR